mmetsp:Transcript_7269/g.14929  ORF Transcript_7269/g.14929 Transcript_7269/m.14929 type:complete len:511 (+) Transcript_7269:250-1782(+)
MSYDASSLRGYLQRIDGSAPSIQGAAGAMMKHYDKSPGVAVGEWRNALIQARGDHQYLPLLYVANEVLQNSKRNRGNKFLEAFSPVLGQSLIFVCGKSSQATVESIRRTVKIWAERRVFSIRYVNELIKGLEPYRSNNSGGSKRRHSLSSGSTTHNRSNTSSSARTTSGATSSGDDGMHSPGGSSFSPVTDPTADADASPHRPSPDTNSSLSLSSSRRNNTTTKNGFDSDRDNDDHQLFGVNDDESDADGKIVDDSDSDDDLFGSAGKKLLKIDVDLDKAEATTLPNSSGAAGKKRRRNSDGSGARAKPKAKSRFLSASSLVELMNQVSTLQANYDNVAAKLREVGTLYASGNASNNKPVESLVGDELLEEYKKTLQQEERVKEYQKELHAIARAKRARELEALRYLPWLERALEQDRDDIDFSKTFRKQLDQFRGVHGPSKKARDQRLKEEERRLEKEEELKRKQREEEERKKFMESAMSKQTEAQPGMVWNRATQEYQLLNQEESWRD